MSRFVSLFAGFAASALFWLTSPVYADNWARFRGPNGSGVSNDTDIPTKFDAKQGVLWKARLDGVGHSCPIVWGDRLFLQISKADGSERSLVCFGTADGKELWKQSISASNASKGTMHSLNSLASATPATDGEAVYVPFWDGKNVHLYAYSFQGKLMWNRDLGPWFSQHGPGGSPIIYKDKVIFVNDMDHEVVDKKTKKASSVLNPSKLYAFDKKTGTTVWEMPREAYRACYSAPFILEKKGTAPELIITSTTAITSYDPDTGKSHWNWKWSFSGMPLRTVSSTAYVNGTLLTCSGDGSGDRHMVAVATNGFGKDARPGLLWENKKDFPYVTCPLTHGDHVYFANDGGMIGCFHVKTGKKVWFERLPDAKFSASPVMINGKVYACSEQGDVYVFNAEPTIQEPIRNSLREAIIATPAVANGRLYIRGKNHLFCIGNK
jgi:outer membrane protein assembly factor BamB